MRIPKFSLHKASGQWFIHYAGKTHYLGRDKRAAKRAYLEHLDRWREWTEARANHAVKRTRRHITIDELIDAFAIAKRTERGHDCERYYLKHTKRLRYWFGDTVAEMFRPRDFNEFKLGLIEEGFAARTVNHDLTACKVLFAWASMLELIPMVNFAGIKNLPVGPTQPRFMPHDALVRAIRTAKAEVRPWLAVNYLALLRPSEVVKVVHKQGEWIEDGVFVLDRGKMDARATIKRHCVFSPVALSWLSCCEPRWSRLDSYSPAARKAGVQPKILQKSAARHLAEQGCRGDDIDALLSHSVRRITASYWHPVWQRLREVAAGLRL